MENSTIAVSASTLPDERQQLWNAFRYEVRRLWALPVEPENFPEYYRLVDAYRALRAYHVTPRKGRKVGKDTHDPTLVAFVEESGRFRDRYYGLDEGHYVGTGNARKWKTVRRWKGVAPNVRAVMEAYGKLRDAWHYRTPVGKQQRAKANRRYMRTAKGQAVKAAYLASEAGRATVARGIKAAARKRKVAKGEAEQAMFDRWATEEAIEGALADA